MYGGNRSSLGITTEGFMNKRATPSSNVTSNKNQIPPVPDQRFYTKTNFFTLKSNSKDSAPVSE